jgi:geranylgeranyl diphosphate synthase, type II
VASANKVDLAEYLQRKSRVIDRGLEGYLSHYPGGSQTIFKAMRYGIFPGGKRIRSILSLAAGELFGAAQDHLLPFACAVEMIHAYSLVHDDLPALDDDDVRRGEPAAHKVFGEGMALLAGDALLTEAFLLMSNREATREVPAEQAVRVIYEIAHAAGAMGLVGGQALDMEAEGRDVDLATVDMIHVRKTGALILAAVRIGALIGGASGEDLTRISRYGEYLGLAFQIADDVLDAQAGGGVEKRSELSRREHKKATYPSAVGIVTAKERLAELLQLSLDALAQYSARADVLAAIARHIVGRAIHVDAQFIEETHG